MFVLLPMLRLSMTKLRQKGFNYLLPLDKHTSFHRMTGQLIVIYSLLHTLAHVSNLGNWFKRRNSFNTESLIFCIKEEATE